MSCVNDRYSPEELESIFLWDCLCEALPLTAEERREIKERDYTAKAGSEGRNDRVPSAPSNDDEEERKRKKRERNRRWREANKERIRAYEADYRLRNRDSINERQREYDRAKRASEKGKRISAQP